MNMMEKLHTNALSVPVAMVQMMRDDVSVPVHAEGVQRARALKSLCERKLCVCLPPDARAVLFVDLPRGFSDKKTSVERSV